MGNPKPTTKFKPGNPGGGRKKIPEEIKEIAISTKKDIAESYFKFSRMSMSEAEKYKPQTLLEAGILKCFELFIKRGQVDQMCKIWAEVHGKPKESMELSGNVNSIIYLDKQDSDL